MNESNNEGVMPEMSLFAKTIQDRKVQNIWE